MMSLKTVVGLAVLSQALALPMFYDQKKDGCEIPAMGFGSHQDPTKDETITFMLTDATGTAVTVWEPGMEYTLEVGAYSPNGTNAWIHSSGGTLSSADASYTVATCEEAIYSSVPVPLHTVTWTAPETAGCVTVSTAQAAGQGQGYNTNMVELCAEGAGAPAPADEPMAVVPMADVPMADVPVEAEEALDAGVDEAVDETGDAVDDATDAVDDAADEAEVDGVAGPAGVLAAVAAAAAMLAAAV